MEKLLDLSGTPSGMLVALCVIFTINVLMRVGEFLWKFKEKKDALTEKGIKELARAIQLNTDICIKLEARIQVAEKMLSEVTKFKLDMRRSFVAIRTLADERWPEIRKKILEEELDNERPAGSV